MGLGGIHDWEQQHVLEVCLQGARQLDCSPSMLDMNGCPGRQMKIYGVIFQAGKAASRHLPSGY